MKILLATANPAKVKDFQLLLADLPLELVTPNDVGITEIPKETGKTFEENARLKAEWYMKKSGLPALADDGGIEIDALSGMPGVYSRRWPFLKTGEDREATDEEMIAYTLAAVEGLPIEKRGAQIHVFEALAMPDGKTIIGDGVLRGYIAEKPLGKPIKNFPFRELLFIPTLNKYFGEFTEYDHKRYNERIFALQPIKVFLQSVIASGAKQSQN